MRHPVRTRHVVLLSTLCVVTSCKKSDPAAAGAASGAAVQAAATAPSLSDFEGDITIVSKSAKEKRPVPPITLTVKGNKLRFDLPEGMEGAPKMGERAYAIADTTTKKLDVVVDEQKMIMEMDLASMGDQLKKMKPHNPAEPETKTPPKVTKTGHTDTVAGMSCEDWDVTSERGERGRVCVASTSASWLSLPSLGLPSEQMWAKELFDGQHLPLRMIGYDAAGTEENRLEVTKLEKKPIADATFVLPAGYRTMDFTQMMAGVQGMLAGMGGPNHGAGPVFPSALPPGLTLPPGMTLPQGMGVTPGMAQNAAQIRQNAAQLLKELQERAKAAGVKPPPTPTQ
jgi:hypothetical protein